MQMETRQFSSIEDGQPDSISYLSHRARQEAEAAIGAASVAATTIHVVLATAYANRAAALTVRGERSSAERWVDEHRIW